MITRDLLYMLTFNPTNVSLQVAVILVHQLIDERGTALKPTILGLSRPLKASYSKACRNMQKM